MKLSKIVLAISIAINATAAKLSSNVAVPALRKAANLKARALDMAYEEHDKAYWKTVDTHVAARGKLKRIEQAMKAAVSSRTAANKARNTWAKERVL